MSDNQRYEFKKNGAVHFRRCGANIIDNNYHKYVYKTPQQIINTNSVWNSITRNYCVCEEFLLFHICMSYVHRQSVSLWDDTICHFNEGIKLFFCTFLQGASQEWHHGIYLAVMSWGLVMARLPGTLHSISSIFWNVLKFSKNWQSLPRFWCRLSRMHFIDR